jgi:hypothetical protein
MSGRTSEVEELVVKNGGHGHGYEGSSKKGYPDKDYPEKDYPEKDYPKKDYPEKGYADKRYFADYPDKGYKGYPGKGYPEKEFLRKGYFRRGVFETPIPVRGLFDGEIYAAVYEQGGAGPTNIIRTDQNWGVIVKWKTSGSLVRMICGKWCLQMHLESMGPGPELTLPVKAKHLPLDPCGTGKYERDKYEPWQYERESYEPEKYESGKYDDEPGAYFEPEKYEFDKYGRDKYDHGHLPTVYYKCRLEIPRGCITAEHCSNLYKLFTTLTYYEPCGTPGPIAAYVEGQVLQFYEP